jgi:hypothetical protein
MSRNMLSSACFLCVCYHTNAVLGQEEIALGKHCPDFQDVSPFKIYPVCKEVAQSRNDLTVL